MSGGKFIPADLAENWVMIGPAPLSTFAADGWSWLPAGWTANGPDAALPNMTNPLRLIPSEDFSLILVAGIDAHGGIVVGALDIAEAIISAEPT